jgi:hypothetical protein
MGGGALALFNREEKNAAKGALLIEVSPRVAR